MPEIGTSGSMSGDGKRSAGHRPQATAPILDSTTADISRECSISSALGGTSEASGWVAVSGSDCVRHRLVTAPNLVDRSLSPPKNS